MRDREGRQQRREERSQRTADDGPTPHNTGPRKTTTDADKVRAAYVKRERRKIARLENAERRREGKR
jgi:hypothetical protein